LIYERGDFSAFDTQQTAVALAFYALGLAGYAAIKVLAPAFYALDDARTPMLVSLASIVTNYLLNWWLVSRLGHRGLALSTSCVAGLNFIVLFVLMRRRLRRLEGRRIAVSLLKVIAASAVMSVACWWTYQMLLKALGQTGLWSQVINAFLPIGVGVVVFLISCQLLKVSELELAIQVLTRRFKKRTG
jgi:putative peptidoglycan lipid II flippase